ncbi:MAG: ATP-binding protein [Elusimicrobia bacterium]|nr:ATP-binding protein [Elusimicrobiota bacterium]
MFQRLLKPLRSGSFFLFGARGSGKSTFVLKQFLPPSEAGRCLILDLLDPEVEDRYARDPKLLERLLDSMARPPRWVVIDEVQRVPRILDMAHRLIESKGLKFILTGSSARKLRSGASNLLAGRAFLYRLFPLTQAELGPRFDLDAVLHWGSLPRIFSLKTVAEKRAYLRSYGLTYLKEEIQAEQVVRRLDPFREFLEVAAQANGTVLNASRVARQIGVDVKTVQSYFQILADTWAGFFLPAYHRSVRKSQTAHPKFFLFDPGVKRALERSLDSGLASGTSAYGDAFEHWVVLEFQRLNEYAGKDYRLSYLRTKDGAEADLVLSKPGSRTVLVEIKSSARADELEARKLRRLQAAVPDSAAFYLSRDELSQTIDGVRCLPWHRGLAEIFGLR